MPEQTEQTPQAPQAQPTGLTENGTCALAYITPVPAIVFLVTAPYNQNPKVRFHSWQSILLFIAAVGVSIVLRFIWRIPGLNLINFLLEPLVGLAFFIIWVIMIFNAFNGKAINIPVLSAFAAKQSGFQV